MKGKAVELLWLEEAGEGERLGSVIEGPDVGSFSGG